MGDFAPSSANLAPSWSILAPTWPNLVPTWPNMASTWPNLVPTWPQLGPNFAQLGSNLASTSSIYGGLGAKMAPELVQEGLGDRFWYNFGRFPLENFGSGLCFPEHFLNHTWSQDTKHVHKMQHSAQYCNPLSGSC